MPAAAPAAALDTAQVLPVLLDMGEMMLVAGADVNLVERTLARVGRAYGARRMNVFVITAVVVATMTLADGAELTSTRRVDTKGDTNFAKLEKLNALARAACEKPLPPAELAAELARLDAEPFPRAALYAGGVLAAGSFAVFFGGTLVDGAVSALFALLICLLMEKLKPLSPNNIVFNFVAALIAGIGIGGVAVFVPDVHVDMVMIGDIMLLIPGIAMTNAARDMLAGDTIAGVMRLVESLLWACALALGFMAALFVTGAAGAAPPADTGTFIAGLDARGFALVQVAVSLPASAGFALLFNLRERLILPAAAGGVLSWGIYLVCGQFLEGIFLPCLVAAAFAALFAEGLARHYRVPSAVFFIITMIPLIPGRGLFYTMDYAVRADWATCGDFALLTLSFALAIAVGMSAVWAASEIARKARQ